jgi:hypothetical protein
MPGRKSFRVRVRLAAGCAAVLLLAAKWASAETLGFTGDTTRGGNWARPEIDFFQFNFFDQVPVSGWLAPTTSGFIFQTFNFRVRGGGPYTISSTPITHPGTVLYLYRAPFNPAAGLANGIVQNEQEDTFTIPGANRIDANLAANTNYVVVVTGCVCGTAGSYFLSIVGNGEIVLSDAEIGTGTQSSTIVLARSFLGALQQQLGAAQDGRNGAEAGNRVQLAELFDAAARGGSPDAGEARSWARWLGRHKVALWLSGFGGTTRLKGESATGSSTLSANHYGGAAGADMEAAPRLVAGISFAVGGAKNRIEALGAESEQRSYQVALYASWREGPWRVDASFGGGFDRFETTRGFEGMTKAKAYFDGSHILGAAELQRRFEAGPVAAAPYAGVQWTTLFQGGYTEDAAEGSGLVPLAVESRASSAVRSLLGLRLEAKGALAGGRIALGAHAAWAHEFARERMVRASIVGSPGFVSRVDGARLPAESAVLGASLSWALAEALTLRLGYEGQVGARFAMHTASLSLRLGL